VKLRQLRDKLETAQGRADVRWAISRVANRALYRCGFALLSDHFYQPLPTRRALLEHHLDPSFVAAVDEQARFVASLLEANRNDLSVDLDTFGYGGSVQLPRVDAEVLYAMVRYAQPQRVVEVGSGSSTAVIAAALHRNANDHGRSSTFTSIDPYALPHVGGPLHADVVLDHRAEPLQTVDPSLWRDLRAGDIFFVDSSHVFKAGSDVEFEFLQIYPSLRSGVFLHLHDIFLPGDYPLDWNLRESRFWNEQYVLSAVLENSSRYRVIAALAAIHLCRPMALEQLIPEFSGDYSPGSIWLTVQ